MTYAGLGIKQAILTNKKVPWQEKVGNTEPEEYSGCTHHRAD